MTRTGNSTHKKCYLSCVRFPELLAGKYSENSLTKRKKYVTSLNISFLNQLKTTCVLQTQATTDVLKHFYMFPSTDFPSFRALWQRHLILEKQFTEQWIWTGSHLLYRWYYIICVVALRIQSQDFQILYSCKHCNYSSSIKYIKTVDICR